MRAATLITALALGTATPAAATPGFVTGEGIGTVYLELAADPALDITLSIPNYPISYSSFGSYHEDGFSTSSILDPNSILLGFDLYAYAFSSPFVPTPHSEVNGQGYFVDSIFATISNPTGIAQQVDALIDVSLSLVLNAEQPNDLTSGSIGYQLNGSGSGVPSLSLAYTDALAPSANGGTLSYGLSDHFLFTLQPGEEYSFGIQDFGASFFLRAQAVPEPGTWAMMIIGFAAIGYSMRRTGREQPRLRPATG